VSKNRYKKSLGPASLTAVDTALLASSEDGSHLVEVVIMKSFHSQCS